MRWTRQHSWTLLAVLAGALVRVCFIRVYPHVYGDSLVYGDLANNLLQHHAFALTEGSALRPTLIRLPGYPLLVAACFAVFGAGKFSAVLYMQAAMDLGTCVLLALLAGRVAGPRAFQATLWLAALCPFTANYTAAPLTETPAMFCAALAFYALERWSVARADAGAWNRWLWTMAAALLFALSLRPDRGLLAVAVLSAVLGCCGALARSGKSWWERMGPGLAIVLVMAVLPVSWAIRNWKAFHRFEPLAPRSAMDPGEMQPLGFDRWYRTWAVDLTSTFDVYWTYDGAPLSVSDLPERALDSEAQRAETAGIYESYNVNPVATPAVDARFATLARERVRGHLLRYYVALPVARVANMWLRPRTEMLPLPLPWWRWHERTGGALLAMAMGAMNLGLLVLAAMGLWRWRRTGWSGRRTLGYAMVFFVLLRSALLLTLDNSEPRYTLDCFPVVLLLAGLAIAGWRGKGAGRGRLQGRAREQGRR